MTPTRTFPPRGPYVRQDGDVRNCRVTKKLDPTRPGAIKLANRFGAALVCVRHRVHAHGRERVTTVELVVERVPIRPRVDPMVAVRIGWNESTLQAGARAEGAKWDAHARVWRMPRSVAKALDLDGRIVGEK